MSGEITCKPSRGHSYNATVDKPKLVPQTTQTAGGGTIVIQPKRDLFVLPGTQQLHPLREKLTFLACHLSGNFSKTEVFLRKQPTLSCTHGGTRPVNNMMCTFANGSYSVLQGKLI